MKLSYVSSIAFALTLISGVPSARADIALQLSCAPPRKCAPRNAGGWRIPRAYVTLLGDGLAQGSIHSLSYVQNDGTIDEYDVREMPVSRYETSRGETAYRFSFRNESSAVKEVKLLIAESVRSGISAHGRLTIVRKDGRTQESDVQCSSSAPERISYGVSNELEATQVESAR